MIYLEHPAYMQTSTAVRLFCILIGHKSFYTQHAKMPAVCSSYLNAYRADRPDSGLVKTRRTGYGYKAYNREPGGNLSSLEILPIV